jgi:RsmE family RNA methyltransferase
MNLLLLKDSDFIAPDRARVSGRRLEHARKILKLEEGDSLKAGLLGGRVGSAKVGALSEEALELVDCVFDAPPPPPLPLSLIVALPRPQSLKKLLHFTASSGVKTLYLIASARVEKSYWNSSALRPEALAEEVELGLEQGVDTIPPELEFRKSFRDFARDELPSLMPSARKFIAHPGPYELCPPSRGQETLLAIGPEGGFVERELEAFSKAGFKTVSAGARILRVEFAVSFIAGMLLSEGVK